MKQIEKEIAEINRMRVAIKNTSSKYLIRDYNKAITQKIKDLKEYCYYRNINYNELKI